MSNDLQVFNYQDREVRTVEIDGEAWFVGKDIADILQYTNPQKAIRNHVDAEDKRGERIVTPSGTQTATVINECGLYSLILSSKLHTAKEFKHWITHDILSSIRKSGIYMTDNAADAYLHNPEIFKAMAERCSALERKVTELHHKIDEMYHLHILGSVVLPQKGTITFKDAADLLAEHGIDIG